MPIIPQPPMTQEQKDGYRAAIEDIRRHVDNQLGTARNRNEYQHGRLDALHELRQTLTERLSKL